VLWLLAPRGVPWRATGLALMLPAVAWPAPAPAPGEAWITTLDVGQGLAVLVRTSHRALLYDAGPAFGGEGDSGERIVAPYLRAAGIESIEAMIVSHRDSDHSGGAVSVLENFPVATLLSSLPAGDPLPGFVPAAMRCAAGETWVWEGVRFEVLHPAQPPAAAKKANNLSCVLKVSAGGHAMLLTGDIEVPAEAELLARSPAALSAEVLLVPHHGSRTSSSAAFLAAVRPAVAVVPVGYRNRFRHPSAEVLDRYGAAQVRVYRTDHDGAVTVRLSSAGLDVTSERQRHRRYWHDPPP